MNAICHEYALRREPVVLCAAKCEDVGDFDRHGDQAELDDGRMTADG
jgi:hypothetical protein